MKTPSVIKARRRPSRESRLEFLWEVFCCWMLAVGIGLLEDVQFAFPTGLIPILIETFVATALLALFTRHWFTLPILLTQAFLCGLLWLVFVQTPISEIWHTVTGFLGWWFGNMPEDSPFFTEQSMAVVHGVLNVGISCLLFFVVRISQRAWPPMIFCGTVLLVTVLYGDSTNNPPGVLALLIGIFPLVARDSYCGRQLFSKAERFRLLGKRWGTVTTAGILSLCVAGLLWGTLPADTRNVRTRVCSNITADIQSFTGLFTTDQRENSGMTLEDIGLQPNGARLGAELNKPVSAVLATTDTDSSQLVKMAVFDTFTGFEWESTFTVPYRVNGPYKEKQKAYLSVKTQQGVQNLWDKLSVKCRKPQSVKFTLTQSRAQLPQIGWIDSLTENTATKNPALCNEQGELFSFFDYDEGFSYTTQGATIDTDAQFDADDFSVIDGYSQAGEDNWYDDPDNLSLYLQLPEDYSPQALSVATGIADTYAYPFQRAVILCRFFSKANGFHYTTTPGKIKAGENVVDKVLNNQKGYCVHYATAMTTMARSMGIPARMVAGYQTQWNDYYNAFVVDTGQPYAWVECYFRNIGWVPFDPIPRETTAKVDVDTEDTDGTTPPPEEEQHDTEEEEQDQDEEVPDWELLRSPLGTLLLGLLLILLYLILRTLFSQKCYSLSWVKKRFSSRSAQGEYYYRDIFRQLKAWHRPRRTYETVNEWLWRLSPSLGEDVSAVLVQALTCVMGVHYGKKVPTEEEIRVLSDAHALLEKCTRRKMSRLGYFFRRRMFLPILCPAARKYAIKERKRNHAIVDNR